MYGCQCIIRRVDGGCLYLEKDLCDDLEQSASGFIRYLILNYLLFQY
jgi:hypothetical protein